MVYLISALIGYAFGCIQSAFIISKTAGKMDIRNQETRTKWGLAAWPNTRLPTN